MKLLLDIDGVMVQAASWKRVELLDDGFYEFMPKAISGLKEIISTTGASIVITSSHKSTYSIVEWKEIFHKRGIDVDIDKLDDNTNHLSRKEEILNWVKNNDYYENYVIIDDDKSLHELPLNIKEKVVFTQPLIGLKMEDVSDAISILNIPEFA